VNCEAHVFHLCLTFRRIIWTGWQSSDQILSSDLSVSNCSFRLMAHYLLEVCHMNPFVCDRNVSTPMHVICMHGHVEAFDYFLRKEVILLLSSIFSLASQFFKGFSLVSIILSYFLPYVIEISRFTVSLRWW